MMTSVAKGSAPAGGSDTAAVPRNEVLLRGRVRSDPECRELPSGARLVTLRIVVPRVAGTRTTSGSRPSGRTTSDWLDCVVWQPRLQGRLLGWHEGDQVEVRGALRRRFYRTAGTTRTRLEVEVLGAKMVRRARRPAG